MIECGSQVADKFSAMSEAYINFSATSLENVFREEFQIEAVVNVRDLVFNRVH